MIRKAVRRVLLATLLASAASAAAAAPTPVRIGEHSGYTRLVLDAGADSEWIEGRSGDRVDIRFEDPDLEFDVAAARNRIAGGRIGGLTTSKAGGATILTIRLNCRCDTSAFALGDGRVVVDVFDAKASAEAAGDPVPSAEAAEEPPTTGMRAVRPTFASGEPTASDASDDDEEFEEARRRLLSLLAQAANDGFVTLDAEATKEQYDKALKNSDEPSPVNENLRVARGDGVTLARPERAPESTCFADAHFLGEAETERNAAIRRLATLRAALVGEFDAPDKAAAMALARQYLAVGFGAEAANILETLGLDDRGARAIADAGRLLDDVLPPEDGPLMAPSFCRGVHAVLQGAAFARRGDAERALDAVSRADESFSLLSNSVLTDLALDIGTAAAKAGALPQARRMLAFIERAGAVDAAEPRLLSAQILRAEGDFERADYILANLETAPGLVRRRAVVERADMHLAEGMRPDAELLLALASVAFENRRTPVGAEAEKDRILLLTRAGDISGAVRVLRRDFQPVYGAAPNVVDEVRTSVLELVSDSGNGVRLRALETFLSDKDLAGSGELADEIRLAVSNALIETGLANSAIEVLSAISDARSYERDKGLAEAHYRIGALPEAIAIADRRPQDPMFRALKARALLAGGEIAEAARTLDASDPATAAVLLDALWRLGRWNRAADLLQEYYSALAANDPAGDRGVARRLALAAYMAGRGALPSEAENTLAAADPGLLPGFQSFFTETNAPSVMTLDAAKNIAATTARELAVFEDMTADG